MTQPKRLDARTSTSRVVGRMTPPFGGRFPSCPFPASLVRRRATGPGLIAPLATGPDSTWVPVVNPQFNHRYVWLDQSQSSNAKLFVFMAGTGGRPRGYQLVQQEAARLGYHVIGLMYQNNVAVADVCP